MVCFVGLGTNIVAFIFAGLVLDIVIGFGVAIFLTLLLVVAWVIIRVLM